MRLAGHEILRQLGAGGMGTVYLARHLLLGRLVAVKVLLPELSGQEEMLQRTFNEARLLAGLRHPGLVDVYDFGRGDDGEAYIVMEYLEGETLAALLTRGGRLPVAQAVALARQVAGAVAAAHASGVVHRDLKPDNVFLTVDDEVAWGRRARLLDFGIAKLATPQGGVRTQTGRILGTPAYMAPEQWRGAGEIDARCDVYALGAMLFEMVCGRRVFMQDGLGELITAHLLEPPPRPSRLERTVPAWLEAVILHALEKDPARRFASMEELADALSDGLESGPRAAASPPRRRSSRRAVSLPGPTTLSRMASEVTPRAVARRGRVALVIAVAAIVAAAAVALAVATGGGGESARPGVHVLVPIPAAQPAPPRPPPAPPPPPPPVPVVSPPVVAVPAPAVVAPASPPPSRKRVRRPASPPPAATSAPKPAPPSSPNDSINPYPEN